MCEGFCELLGAFAKFREMIITFYMSVCVSARLEQICSYWISLRKLVYLSIFGNWQCIRNIIIIRLTKQFI